MNSYLMFGKRIVFSGGGFFRILPKKIIKNFISQSDYVMTYLHPRDFDNKQPFNNLSFERHIKSKIGTTSAIEKLEYLINEFSFIDIKDATQLIDWSNIQKVQLNTIKE